MNTNLTEQQQGSTQKPLPAMEKQIYALKQCITQKIAEVSMKGSKNKKGAVILQCIIILLSILTTILIGFKVEDDDIDMMRRLSNAALICSAAVAGANMLISFFDYKDLWTHYKSTRNELRSLEAELDFLSSGGSDGINVTELKGMFNRYTEICASINSGYRQIRLQRDEPTGPTAAVTTAKANV